MKTILTKKAINSELFLIANIISFISYLEKIYYLKQFAGKLEEKTQQQQQGNNFITISRQFYKNFITILKKN